MSTERLKQARRPFLTGEDDAWCAECGVKLEIVRPGKHQHPTCSQAQPLTDEALLRRLLLAEVDVLKAENARLRGALQAIVDEVSDGLVPYSSDSYLPAHLVEQARASLGMGGLSDG